MIFTMRLLLTVSATLRLQRNGGVVSSFVIHRPASSPLSSVSSSSRLMDIKRLSHKFITNRHVETKYPRVTFPYFNTLRSKVTQRGHDDNVEAEKDYELQMENLYMEWTIEDDQRLYEYMKVHQSSSQESLPRIASKLGRGLRGVQSRMAKLNDVDSFAYQRLFVKNSDHSGSWSHIESDDSSTDNNGITKKLTPALEVMRRIKWDYSLDPLDFTVEYFDRVEETVMSSPFGAKNNSVKGKEEMFVFAIPEHRIMAMKYKDRIVWDKQKRIDRVFGTMNGNGETIDQVILNYDAWKERQSDIEKRNKERQVKMVTQIKQVLGEQLFKALKDISNDLQDKYKAGLLELPADIIDYVQDAIILFRKARSAGGVALPSASPSTSTSKQDLLPNIPNNDVQALNLFSNIVALLPDDSLRERILQQIHKQVNILDVSGRYGSVSSDRDSGKTRRGNENSQLPDLNEDEIEETFVRGSGAGGQKINKTANKVVLLHQPTQIRVECQETRSLQQNRKIARKRMKLKLDEYWNGSQSKTQMKVAKKVNKKQKAKARNKARQRKKREAKEASKEISD